MKCKNCGAENQEGAKFCSSCGSKLEEDVFETQEVKVEPGQVKCRICGHINSSNEQYCKLCGSQLRPSGESVYTNTNSTTSYSESIYANNKSSTPGMVIGIVSLVGSITCCLFLVGLIGGLAGIFMNIKPIKYNYADKNKAIAGLICSIVALLIGLYILIDIIVLLNDPEQLEQIRQMWEEAMNGAYGSGAETGFLL